MPFGMQTDLITRRLHQIDICRIDEEQPVHPLNPARLHHHFGGISRDMSVASFRPKVYISIVNSQFHYRLG